MADKLRLRLKVWTSPEGVLWVVPLGMATPRDLGDIVLKGEGVMTCYAMRDDEVMLLSLTPEQWNAMPFHWFTEDGVATHRPRSIIPNVMSLGRKVPR